jgi:hypothetical protein
LSTRTPTYEHMRAETCAHRLNAKPTTDMAGCAKMSTSNSSSASRTCRLAKGEWKGRVKWGGRGRRRREDVEDMYLHGLQRCATGETTGKAGRGRDAAGGEGGSTGLGDAAGKRLSTKNTLPRCSECVSVGNINGARRGARRSWEEEFLCDRKEVCGR